MTAQLQRARALTEAEIEAWLEYLRETRSLPSPGRYDEIEPWAWTRLNQRLSLVRTTPQLDVPSTV